MNNHISYFYVSIFYQKKGEVSFKVDSPSYELIFAADKWRTM